MNKAIGPEWLLVSELVKRSDPRRAWGFGIAINEREVRKAIAKNRLLAPHEPLDVNHYRESHVARIAWFVVNGWTDPIEVDLGVPSLGCHVEHIITDGNHRAAAAVFRRDPAIWANVSGEVAEIRKFKPH